MSQTNQNSISPIAAAVSAALATPLVAIAQEDADSKETLDNIIVTATKREANVQDIPAAVQAIPEAMLKEIGALNTEDYVRFMPAVNWISFNSGGSNAVIFRGINTSTSGFIAPQSSSVYLDEIPMTSTAGDQPEIRMMDINRVEALAGPQGTLYGAAAQAGTLRIISNQPDPSGFEANADVTFRAGPDSDVSSSVTAVVNIPLVEDVFAIRIATQSAEDGGFIDNVFGHFPDTWYGSGLSGTRSGWGSRDNADVVEENWNSVKYVAARLSARWDINDDWSATVSYQYGDTDSQGSSSYNPFVGDLQTINFRKNQSRDEWDNTALIIEGDLGFAQLVSATSFFDREVQYKTDATMYFRYYQNNYCGDTGPATGTQSPYGYNWENPVTGRIIYYPLYCPNPVAGGALDVTQLDDMVGVSEGPEWQERFSQELRLSHQGESFDWLVGLYYEDSEDNWDSVWMQSDTPYNESLAYAYTLDQIAPGNPDAAAALLTATHMWHSSDRTDWEQKAVFGEFTWHATDAVNVTLGGRWSETTNTKVYTKILSGTSTPDGFAIGGYTQPRWIGNDIPQTGSVDEFVPKFAVSYNLSDNKMVYGSYSEGYRTGGINRANKNADWTRTLFPQTWNPDKLKNYEMGLRSRSNDNTMQVNLTFFYMAWEDFLTEVVDPSSGTCVDPADEPGPCTGLNALPWLSIVGNAGDSSSTGLTAEFDWVPADGWSVGANATYLEAEIDKGPGFGSDIQKGQRLPNFPELQGALWGTYTWPVQFVASGEMFLRVQYSYQGDSVTKLQPSPETSAYPQFTNDSYGIADVRLGLISSIDGWQFDLFVSNVTDERAQISQGGSGWQWGRTGEYDRAQEVWTVRPREYGVRFSMKWGN